MLLPWFVCGVLRHVYIGISSAFENAIGTSPVYFSYNGSSERGLCCHDMLSSIPPNRVSWKEGKETVITVVDKHVSVGLIDSKIRVSA